MAIGLNNEQLVELGDLDELVRQVDRLADADDWDGLVDLRDRCRRALERGRQLWPAASLAEYRLALDAPGRFAAAVLEPNAGRFALGPLSEVAASTHTWADLAPHAPPTPQAALAAQERVVRGEDLSGDDRIDRQVVELPLALQTWEPRYPTAEYKATEVLDGLQKDDRYSGLRGLTVEAIMTAIRTYVPGSKVALDKVKG